MKMRMKMKMKKRNERVGFKFGGLFQVTNN